MGSDRRAAGTFALLALAFAVAVTWLGSAQLAPDLAVATTDDTAAVASGAHDGAIAPGAATGAPTGGGEPRRRRRAHVRTEEDVRRDDARQALVAQVAEASNAVGAANVRAMFLPGAPRPTPPNWTPAGIRIGSRRTRVPALDLSSRARGGVSHTLDDVDDAVRELAERAADEGFSAPSRKGLRADYFDFLEGAVFDVPDLTQLPPTLTRVDPRIDFATDDAFALPFEPETFGALWRGYLVVETPGDYEFTIGSDDGARLRIAGQDVLEHRSLRPYAETSGRIHLEVGRHPFELTFYENFVFASCRLFWIVPGTQERALVPAAAFEPPDEIAAVDPPRVVSVAPSHGRIGDEITIRGSGFSATASLERVTFADVAAEIVHASPEELVVRVPIGASTGNLVVQVGPLSTRPVAFTVDNLLGLYGEYYLIGTEITDLPDFDALAPYFVRLDGPLHFNEDGLWQMPYDPDVFAVRWLGFLWVPEEDEYEITLLSDDGAYVAIDGQKVVDLPGLHPPIEESKVVALGQGFHPIELRFFENYGLARLSLFWRRRGDPTRVPIPRGFLFSPDAMALRDEPEIAKLEPAAAVSGDEIVIHGRAFGNDARLVRVVFPGEAWVRPTLAADDMLHVRVPHGAGSGALRVHVGVRVSDPAPFTLAEPIGLQGDYFVLTADEAPTAAELPALLAGRSPTFTRTDTRWRYGKRADWDLPFSSQHFAVRWSGTIAVETAQDLTVALQSESAALLRVGGHDVLADVHPHTLREAYAGGRLAPGENAIELYTLHHGGDPRLHVFITPWGRADHLELPPTWLRPRAPR